MSYIQTKSGTPSQLDFVRALSFPLQLHAVLYFMSHISYTALCAWDISFDSKKDSYLYIRK